MFTKYDINVHLPVLWLVTLKMNLRESELSLHLTTVFNN